MFCNSVTEAASVEHGIRWYHAIKAKFLMLSGDHIKRFNYLRTQSFLSYRKYFQTKTSPCIRMRVPMLAPIPKKKTHFNHFLAPLGYIIYP
jgi:hypothetical protein